MNSLLIMFSGMMLYLVICFSNMMWIHNKFITDFPSLILIGLQLIGLVILYIPDWIKHWRNNENKT